MIDFSASTDLNGVNFDRDGVSSPIRIYINSIEQFYLTGSKRDDVLRGGIGNDIIRGNAGNDLITGNTGTDFLYGDDGNDTLQGGDGVDFLRGDAGRDTFVFDTEKAFDQSTGIDVVLDFQTSDKLVLHRRTFTGLTNNQVSFESVSSITQAQQSSAQITYIRSTGALYYNQNGAVDGFGTGGKFVRLLGQVTLTESDFTIQS